VSYLEAVAAEHDMLDREDELAALELLLAHEEHDDEVRRG
jgi:hypothetical protein